MSNNDIDSSNDSEMSIFMLEIADLEQYYNPRHQIIRVKHGNGYFDLKINPGHMVPNRADHLVVAIIPNNFFEKSQGISPFEEALPPGTQFKGGKIKALPIGMCFLTPKRQTLSTTNPQSGNAALTMSDTNMFDMDNVTVAISPHLPDRDYTTEDDVNQGDINNQNVGFFVNKQGTLVIKGLGGSITIGKEGLYFGGKFASESSIRDTGVMSDGPFKHIIPSTMATAWAGISIPNMGMIASIANAGMKYIEVVDKGVQLAAIGVDLVDTLINVG